MLDAVTYVQGCNTVVVKEAQFNIADMMLTSSIR